MLQQPLKENTTSKLKTFLRIQNLSTHGSKEELIKRIEEYVWRTEDELLDQSIDAENRQEDKNGVQDDIGSASGVDTPRKDYEMLLKERDLLLRELALERRKKSTPVQNGGVNREFQVESIANLLGEYAGEKNSFSVWKRQVELVRSTYDLDDNAVRILISLRLRGKALEWFQSKPNHLEISIFELLETMQKMFDQKPNKLACRKLFESRTWQTNESFCDYYHEKMLLANRVPIDSAEIMDYIIDGIPDKIFKNQARMLQFSNERELLKSFENLSLSKREKPQQRKEGAFKDIGPRQENIRCYNCNQMGHISKNCQQPKRKWGSCYRCGYTNHQAQCCPRKVAKSTKTPSNIFEIYQKIEQ